MFMVEIQAGTSSHPAGISSVGACGCNGGGSSTPMASSSVPAIVWPPLPPSAAVSPRARRGLLPPVDILTKPAHIGKTSQSFMVEMVARTNLTLVAHRRSFSGRVRAAMAGAPGCGALCGGRKRPAAAPKSAKTGERSLRKGGDTGDQRPALPAADPTHRPARTR